jgi:hypothetical protein
MISRDWGERVSASAREPGSVVLSGTVLIYIAIHGRVR